MRIKKDDGVLGKVDLALIIHEVLGIPQDKYHAYPRVGSRIVAAIQKVMTDALHRGDYVRVRGFGTFEAYKDREFYYIAKPCIHNSGKAGKKHSTYSPVPMKFPGRKRVHFRPSIQLMAMLNHETPNAREKKSVAKW